MELRHLRYFAAVAEHGNFHRAAERLGISQPALSRQIQALEAELGVVLFERLRHGTALTESGRAFLDDAREVLDAVEHAGERARRIAQGQVGSLRIAFSEASAGHRVVTETISTFRAAEPEVELALVPMASGLQFDALRRNQLDAGFLYRMSQGDPLLQHHGIEVEDVMLAMPRTHPYAAEAELRLEQLRGVPLLCTARRINPEFHDSLMAAFVLGGIRPKIVQEASSAIVLTLVSVGMGLGIVNSATRLRAPDGVVLRPVKDLSVPFRLDLVWRKDNKSRLLRRFVDRAIATAKIKAPA